MGTPIPVSAFSESTRSPISMASSSPMASISLAIRIAIGIQTRYVTPVQNSPVFSNALYSSSDIPTQFVDAVQRAEYFNQMKPDWHTLLAANPKPAATIHIRQSAACPNGPVFGGCNYLFVLKSDGSCCTTILVETHVLGDALVNVLVTDIVGTRSRPKTLQP